MTWPGALYHMYVDERLPDWAARLDAVYEVVWATSWQTDVLTCVARPAAGLAGLAGAHLAAGRARVMPSGRSRTHPLQSGGRR